MNLRRAQARLAAAIVGPAQQLVSGFEPPAAGAAVPNMLPDAPRNRTGLREEEQAIADADHDNRYFAHQRVYMKGTRTGRTQSQTPNHSNTPKRAHK